MRGRVTSLGFFSHLKWLDGRRLLDVIEPYRRAIFTAALDTYGPDGTPVHNMVLAGRGKKNWKSCDLVLAALFVIVVRRSPLGNDAIIAASDEGQAVEGSFQKEGGVSPMRFIVWLILNRIKIIKHIKPILCIRCFLQSGREHDK